MDAVRVAEESREAGGVGAGGVGGVPKRGRDAMAALEAEATAEIVAAAAQTGGEWGFGNMRTCCLHRDPSEKTLSVLELHSS